MLPFHECRSKAGIKGSPKGATKGSQRYGQVPFPDLLLLYQMDQRLWLRLFVVLYISVVVHTGRIPVCQRPNLQDAYYDGPMVLASPGTILNVTCRQQYQEGSPSTTCKNGQWTKPEPPCKLPHCPYPGHRTPHMIFQMPCRYYNCTTSYSCNEGYWYNGTTPIVCQRDNTWTHPVGQCQAVLCPELDPPKNGKIEQPARSYGKTATTICNEGYILSDWKAAKRTCKGDNTWSREVVSCEAVDCSQLPEPQHGRILPHNRTYKSKAITVCDDGYLPSDPDATTRYCQGDNNWDGKAVNCTERSCPKLLDVENGMLSALMGMYKDKVTLQCNSGYMLDGAHTITCNASGQWNAKIGNCIHNKSDPGKTLTFMISLFVTCGIIVGVILGVAYFLKTRFAARLEGLPESQSLLDQPKLHFTFVLAEDLEDTLSEKTTYESFINTLQQSIEVATKELVTSVDVLYLCQKTKRGFLSLTAKATVVERELIDAISNAQIAIQRMTGTLTFHIIPASIEVMDMVQSTLSAEILRVKHNHDGDMDDNIDFRTQYVKLKLQSQETIGVMQRDEIECPDYYQGSLKQDGCSEIEDEDLVGGNDFQRFVMIRGRAGIGKSTLNQRLLWKWANGEWATQFKAIFFLNLRYLITVKDTMDFLYMLSMYSVYKTRTDSAISQHWLDENEMRIMFVLEGLDEVDFNGFLMRKEKSKNILTPLEWCFALMRRDMLKASTLILSSRPFAQLGKLALNLKEKALSDTLKLVQLVGLTRGRVLEFVDKNVREERKEFVWQTLTRNPILMSISSITFYCVALCRILGSWTDEEPKLKTYTQITAYIMKLKADAPLKEPDVLDALATLAFYGLSQEIGKRPPCLTFNSKDFKNLRIKKEITCLMLKTGLLVQTEIPDPQYEDNCTVLNQFVHLLIQEFLAMVGLLACSLEEFKHVLDKLGETEQFSMATLFLYGLAFDQDHNTIKQLIKADQDDLQSKRRMLKAFALKCSDLEAAQIAQESQSGDLAHAVGQHFFKDGCCFKNSKLTVIDILAITFLMKHNPSILKLSLERAELDMISIQEISKFLQNKSKVEEIVLVDDTIDDVCMAELMAGVKVDNKIRSIRLSSDRMTDLALTSVADLISTSRTLLKLDLLGAAVTDMGIKAMAEGLASNRTLESLSVTFRRMTDEGIRYVARALERNTNLEEICIIQPNATDVGIVALGQAVCRSTSISNFRIDCSHMTDDGVKHIAKSLSQNTSLAKLWLHSRRLTDAAVEYLMKALTSQSSLTDVRLFGFYMREVGIDAILQTKKISPNISVRCWEPEITDGLRQLVERDGRIRFSQL